MKIYLDPNNKTTKKQVIHCSIIQIGKIAGKDVSIANTQVLENQINKGSQTYQIKLHILVDLLRILIM